MQAMQEIAVQKDAFAESELPLALGVSKRAAARIARELGVKIGGRRIIPRQKLLDWLEAKARRAEEPGASAVTRPNEFQISSR
jgi:hypothetical protein